MAMIGRAAGLRSQLRKVWSSILMMYFIGISSAGGAAFTPAHLVRMTACQALTRAVGGIGNSWGSPASFLLGQRYSNRDRSRTALALYNQPAWLCFSLLVSLNCGRSGARRTSNAISPQSSMMAANTNPMPTRVICRASMQISLSWVRSVIPGCCHAYGEGQKSVCRAGRPGWR